MVTRLVRLRVPGSVRLRITLTAVVVSAVAVSAGGWLLVRSVEDAAMDAIQEETAVLLDHVAEGLEAGAPPERTIRRDELASNLVEIAYEDGTVLNLVPVAGGRQVGAVEVPDPSDELQGPVAARRTAQTPTGEATVTVTASSDEEIERSGDAVEGALAVGLPVLVGGVAVASWWTVGRALHPVDRIRAEADAISAATLHRRVTEPRSGDEVHHLSRTMNALLGRLEGAVTRQRQLVADASHELRNPIAAMRIDLEAALYEGDRADWPTVARSVLAEEARVESLIDDLLVLAAEDEGAATLPRTDVDLNELAIAEANRGRRVAVSAATDPDPVVVVGSRSQLERVLANLVDNAERHATSQVHLGITNQGGWVHLTVDDDGPGIPQEDRERVFERFTRLDASRSREQGGSGLGLALVRSIVTRHRGSVWVDDSPAHGARFVVALPAPGLPGGPR